MPLVLNEEQQHLKDAATQFFANKSPVSALRKLRDEQDPLGYDTQLWQAMADMGWPGTTIDESYGGLEFGFVGLGLILEASGRTLAASPLFASIALGASSLLLAGNEEQKREFLPAVARGECLLTLAVQEGPHWRPTSINTRATKVPGGYSLSGEKQFVLDAQIANKIIVVARTTDADRGPKDGCTQNEGEYGLSLFIVDSDSPGVSIDPLSMVDSRNMANLQLNEVHVDDSMLLGDVNNAFDALNTVIQRANVALCAEMLGAMQEAFERTTNYLKQREQFGAIIGSFQALQHRAAKMYVEIELCKSVVLKALQAVEENSDQLEQLASLAKVQVGETLKLVSNEGIQMHGGIGMTDEEEIGFFLKRARVALQTLGDENYHLMRYAETRGY